MASPVPRPLPPEAADAGLVSAVDAAPRAGEARADGHLACRVGCTQSCIGPFDTAALDAARLSRGLADLTQSDSEAASTVLERASWQRGQEISAYPGDRTTGIFSDAKRARTVFSVRLGDIPCPALDPASGSCLLYAWRPLSCRTYGLPVPVGTGELEPCPLNLTAAPSEVVAAAGVVPDARLRAPAPAACRRARHGMEAPS